jgi:superfamily II DNA/RNA helicase
MKEPRKVTVLDETAIEKVSLKSSSHAEAVLRGVTHYKAALQGQLVDADIVYIQLETLISIFGEFQFQQCLVFCNDKSALDRYCYGLRNAGFSADFTSGDLNQSIRNGNFILLQLSSEFLK